MNNKDKNRIRDLFTWEGEIYKNNQLNQQWVTLIEKYPSRFMLGTDVLDNFKDVNNYYETTHKYDVLLNALPPTDAKLVAHDFF